MHKARKRFGQNFLHDPYIIDRIIDAIGAHGDQTLVEIGPGKGALTEHLVQQCQHLHVIEIDRDLTALLQKKFKDQAGLHIYNQDALRTDFCDIDPQHKIRLIGNLPYNISTPLIFHILENIHCIEDMHFMLQKEVVERMAAAAGSKAYGRLSIMTQYYCDVTPLFDVPPESFQPAPKVESSIVQLVPAQNQRVEVQQFKVFSQIVNQAFSMRRKTLRNALKNWLDAEEISACDIDPGQRPETLDMEAYARLSNYYSNKHQE